ncbi:ABC transporter-like protein [Corchorus capsularis]|uniref:ABC transporter-like protein n=1 Tax=Corchorus capsularis TaxID=210143 RepID=A0A1R3KFD8_COCAP|nr:ABC transporter-like protein [Corchorus capsularis]
MEHQSASPSPPPRSPPPPLKTYRLTASSVSYTKLTTSTTPITDYFLFKPCTSTPPTYILRDVSFTANPSQILAIVGPSGAGKSTLLDILAARTSPTNGTLLLNSTPINPSSFRKLSAYVPQHDACLPLLTVAETFAFAARLLVPKAADIDTIVTSLLSELRLSHLANTKLAHGLSGGERRRVSIGLSLLHDPAVLLLDEPTSGLDSTSAFNVMQILKSIATSRHRTIVLSIHQPSFKILSTIDRILLLSKGTVVHHGTLCSLQVFLQSNGFTVPSQLNALEYAMEILNQLHESKPITPISLPSSPEDSVTTPENDQAVDIRYRSSRLHEICSLYNRFWKIIYRTRQLLLTNALEALIVGLVLGTIYINIGFDKEVLMANSFVLFLSSLAPNYIAGTSLVTILLGAFFLFSGYFISKDSLPKYWLFMHFLSMYKYALDALLINEYSCLVSRCFLWYNETRTCMLTGGDVLQKKGLHVKQRWTNIYILVGFFVFYRVLCLLVLIRRISRSKK